MEEEKRNLINEKLDNLANTSGLESISKTLEFLGRVMGHEGADSWLYKNDIQIIGCMLEDMSFDVSKFNNKFFDFYNEMSEL